MPNLQSGLDYDLLIRKLAHVTEYAILTFLLRRAFKHSYPLNPRQLFIYPAIIALLYAASDEYHQTFVQGRHGAIIDVCIDSLGILGLYGIIFITEKMKRVKKAQA